MIPLALVGTGLITSLALLAGAIAIRLNIDMTTLPDTNLLMGTMIGFGFFLASTVLGYMVSLILFFGFLAFWSIVCVAGVGITIYLYETQELRGSH